MQGMQGTVWIRGRCEGRVGQTLHMKTVMGGRTQNPWSRGRRKGPLASVALPTHATDSL